MKTVFAAALRALIVLLMLSAVAVAQSDDRGFVTRLLEDNLSGAGRTVTLTGFAGALSSRATVQEITIADAAGVWLTLRDVAIRWNRSALLSARIEIDELSAAEIILVRPPQSDPSLPPAEAQGFALPDLPVAVRIGNIRAGSLSLGAAVLGTAAVVSIDGALNVAGGAGDARLSIARIDGANGSLDLTGSFANDTGLLVIDLALTEGAGGIAAGLIGLPGAPPLSLTITGAGPLSDYAADITLATDGEPRLAGRVAVVSETAAGAAAPTRRFSADLGGDIAPLLAPDYRAFFGPDVRLTASGSRTADGRLDVPQITVRAQQIELSGRVVVGADGLPEVIDLSGTVQSDDGTPVLLPLPGERSLVDRVGLAIAFDAAAGPDWRGTFDVRNLSRPGLTIATLELAGTGQIMRQGDTAQGSIAADLTFAARGVAPADPAVATALGPDVTGTARLAWTEGAPLELSAFSLDGADYGLTARATFSGLAAALEVDGAVTAQLRDLTRLAPLAGRPLAGAATGRVTGRIAPLAGTFDLETVLTGQDLGIGQPEVDRLLTGPSEVAASVVRSAAGITLRALTVSAGSLTAQANGTLRSGASEVQADLTLADLSRVRESLGGAVRASVRLVAGADAQDVTVTATGQALRSGQPQLDALLAAGSTLRLAARRSGDTVTISDFALDASTLSARITGALRAGSSALRATLDMGDLSVLGSGFSGALAAAADLTETGTLRRVALTGTARNLAVAQPQADRVLRGETAVVLDATEDRGTISVERFSLTNPQLRATATATPEGADRRISVDARLADLALVAPGFPGPLTLQGAVLQSLAGYVLDLRAAGPGGIDTTVAGNLTADFKAADLRIRGGAQTALLNGFIAPRSVQGPVSYDLTLRGTPSLAALSGTVRGSGLRVVADPALGIAVENIAVSAALDNARARIDGSGTLAAGGGIAVSGPVSLAAPYDADLTLTLTRARLRDPELYQTDVTGPVTITGPLQGGALIAGNLTLSGTEVQVPSTGLGGTGAIAGLIHQNEPADVRATRGRAGLIEDPGRAQTGPGRAYPLDLTISAPRQVFIRGRGLDAELGGTLRLSGTTLDVVPLGRFELIRGRLDILGKRFTLDEGSASIEGRFVPFVRLVASTASDGITASIIVEGDATEPDISFVSSPELPEEEVLARLLFDRGLASMSPLQAAQLASAVATLAGRGGEGIISRLRTGFGLDDLDVVTDPEGGAAVRVGKYLGTNVYTDVTLGAEGNTEVNLNLDVTPSLTLRGSAVSDGDTSVGVFFERDY